MSPSPRSDVISFNPSLVALFVAYKRTEQYFQVATATLLVYDTMTTVDREVKYFWRASWSLNKTIYFINRYVGIFSALSCIPTFTFGESISICRFSNWAFSLASLATILSVDYILTVRALVLYSKDRRLTIFLGVVLASVAACGLCLISIYLILTPAAVDLVADLTMCGLIEGPISAVLYSNSILWSIPMAYGLILIGLALYKAAEYWKTSPGIKGFPLVKILIQDLIFYHLLFILCSVFNIIDKDVHVENNIVFGILQTIGNPAILCISASRLFFRLKEAGERGVNEGTGYKEPTGGGERTLSNMEFA